MEKRSEALRRAAPAVPVAVPKKEPETGHGGAEEPNTSIDVFVCPDPFECPLCFELFEAVIFQCENGHVACQGCCDRLQGTCPICREPIGANRCRAMEDAVAAIHLYCQVSNAGCKKMIPLAGMRAHEAYCLPCHYARVRCHAVPTRELSALTLAPPSSSSGRP